MEARGMGWVFWFFGFTSGCALEGAAIGVAKMQHQGGVSQQSSIVHFLHSQLQGRLGCSSDGGIVGQEPSDAHSLRWCGGSAILISSIPHQKTRWS